MAGLYRADPVPAVRTGNPRVLAPLSDVCYAADPTPAHEPGGGAVAPQRDRSRRRRRRDAAGSVYRPAGGRVNATGADGPGRHRTGRPRGGHRVSRHHREFPGECLSQQATAVCDRRHD